VAGRINSSVRQGASLVDGLLQFSRKQIKAEFELIDLVEVIDEICQIIRKSFDQKIEIQSNLPEQLPIMGDSTSLSQALMNLCTNARDAMPNGGKLIITGKQEGRRMVVTVSDTGQGMDSKAVEKCFDPFFTTKPIGKGTGLGLSTTYGIIKSHEGLISVDSRPNQGATFKIHLPAASPTEQNKGDVPPAIVRGKGQCVLVVDDEPEIRNAMKGLLDYLGYRPEFASSGKEGLAKYRQRHSAAVLMDINMPEMDGVACIEEILNYDPAANIAIISGYEEESIDGLSKAVRKHVKDYRVKPLGLGDLSELLAGMFKG
jgi:CheY-like chemotaxis protein